MAGRRRTEELQQADPKLVAKFKAEAKKQGGRVIEQGKIHSWADCEVGFELSGDLVAVREGVQKPGSNMQPGFLVDLVESETGEVETWGCPAILKSRFDQAQVEKGDSIRILYTGLVPSKRGQPAHDFVLVHYPRKP